MSNNPNRAVAVVGSFGRSKSIQIAATARDIENLTSDGGILPIDVLTSNMRHFFQKALSLESKRVVLEQTEPTSALEKIDWQESIDKSERKEMEYRLAAQGSAKEAAPYFHPRLSKQFIDAGMNATIQHQHTFELASQLENKSDHELTVAWTELVKSELPDMSEAQGEQRHLEKPKPRIKRAE
jgi:hypothetical protein